MTTYFQSRPCDIEQYRKDTERGYSHMGVSMTRKCCNCGKKIPLHTAKKHSGFGTRHDPYKWCCKDGCNANQ